MIIPSLLLALGVAHAGACGPAPLARAQPLGSEILEEDCVSFGLDAAARGFVASPAVGISRGLSLQRFRAEVGLHARSDVSARLASTVVRSGGDDGYIGIAGESLVPVVQIAEARWDWRAAGLALAGGVVDDPWVMTVQPAWGLIAVAPPLATDQAWLPRSDVGGWAGWTARDGFASATVAVTTGEGLNRRERNNGTNITGVARIRPLASGTGPVDLEVAAMARDGSRGIGQAPDHRAGAAVIAHNEFVVAGLDAALGWGLDGDGQLDPAGVSAWVRTGSSVPALGWARVDAATDDRDVSGAGEVTMRVGAGPRLPLRAGAPASLVIGWQGRRFGPDGGAIAGAALRSDLWFVQLGGILAGSAPLQLQ